MTRRVFGLRFHHWRFFICLTRLAIGSTRGLLLIGISSEVPKPPPAPTATPRAGQKLCNCVVSTRAMSGRYSRGRVMSLAGAYQQRCRPPESPISKLCGRCGRYLQGSRTSTRGDPRTRSSGKAFGGRSVSLVHRYLTTLSGRRSTHREPSLPTNFCGTLKLSLRVPRREPLVAFLRLWCDGMKGKPHPLAKRDAGSNCKIPLRPLKSPSLFTIPRIQAVYPIFARVENTHTLKIFH